VMDFLRVLCTIFAFFAVNALEATREN